MELAKSASTIFACNLEPSLGKRFKKLAPGHLGHCCMSVVFVTGLWWRWQPGECLPWQPAGAGRRHEGEHGAVHGAATTAAAATTTASGRHDGRDASVQCESAQQNGRCLQKM